MEFTLPAGALAHAVGLVKGCVPSRTTIPILNHVLIEARAGEISVRATNLDMEATARSHADVAADGDVTVSGEILHGIVKRCPKNTLATLKMSGNRVAMLCGRSSYELAVLPAGDFPQALPIKDGVTFQMPAAALAGMFASTRYAVGTDESRFYLHGVFLHVVDGMIAAVAADGHRFGKRTCALPAGAEGMPGVIVPTAATREIVDAVGEIEGDVTLTVSASRIQVAIRDFVLSSALIDSTYIDYAPLIPKPVSPVITVKPAALADAVDRAMVIYQGTDTKAPKVVITAGAKGVDVSTSAGATGQGVEDVEAVVHERGAEISVNARYLAEMLKLWPDVDMDIQPNGPGAPVLFTAKDVPDMAHIIMPQIR